MRKASETEVGSAMASLPGWKRHGRWIRRVFVFKDFAAPFTFMARVAEVAEQQNHHPDWRNSWNRVEVRLTTHDAGGLTIRDFRLAAAINGLAEK